MKITIRLDMGEHGTHEVSTNLWVVTQWERKYRRKASDLAQGIGVELQIPSASLRCAEQATGWLCGL